MQARCEASEAEVQHLQQRLHAASADRSAELNYAEQLNRSLKAEVAALQNRLSGLVGADFNPQQQSGATDNTSRQVLESFGSCVLVDPSSSLGQSLSQVDDGKSMPFVPAHRLAPIPEGDGSVSNNTSMQGDEVLPEVHLVPELQSQVRALAASLHDKTQEAEALSLAVEQFRLEVRATASACNLDASLLCDMPWAFMLVLLDNVCWTADSTMCLLWSKCSGSTLGPSSGRVDWYIEIHANLQQILA